MGNHKDITWCASAKEAMQGVDAILIPTEWAEFRMLEFAVIGETMRQKVLFDFRNIYKKNDVQRHGFEYYGTGVC